jgi:hypothetical protein
MPRLRAPTNPLQEFDTRQCDIWDHLQRCAEHYGGSIITVPYMNPVRLCCLSTSPLHGILRDQGYPLREVGRDQRLMPKAVTERRGNKTFVQTAMVLQPVTIHEITIA